MQTPRRKALLGVLAVALATMAPGLAHTAQGGGSYPSRAITLVVPYGAGSSTDILTRVIAQRIAQDLGKPIVVENRAGAGGSLGSGQVAKATPDGHTLVMGTISSHSINATMMDNLPYDVLRDFAPVSLIAYFPNVLAVNKDLPVANLAELADWTKQGKALSYATGGIGSSGQMAGELLQLKTGAVMEHVPYSSVGQAISDTLAGHVPVLVYQVPALASHIKEGNLKALAVLAPERTPLLPDVPTPQEQGIADFDATAWMGLFAPAGTPETVINRLNDVIRAALQDPALREQLQAQGFTLVGSSPQAFREFVATDIQKWAHVVKAAATEKP